MKTLFSSIILFCFLSVDAQHTWEHYSSDKGIFPTKINKTSNATVRNLTFTNSDTFYIGCYRDGLVEFWPDNRLNFVVYNDSNSLLEGFEVHNTCLSKNQKYLWYTDYNSFEQKFIGLQRLNIYSLLPDKNEYYRTIFLYDTLPVSLPHVHDILEIANDSFLFATDKGILIFDRNSKWHIQNVDSNKIPTDNWKHLAYDPENETLYGANDQMIYRKAKDKNWETINLSKPPYNLKEAYIKKMKQGINDTLWVITQKGIVKFKDSHFEVLTNAEVAGSKYETKDLTFDSSGTVWYAFENNMGIMYKAKNEESNTWEKRFITSVNANIPDEASVIQADNYGNIWIGTDNDGIYKHTSFKPTSIAKSTRNLNIAVYPNPARGGITIKSLDNIGNIYACNLYDLQGKLLKTFNLTQELTIAENLKPGIYLLKVEHKANLNLIRIQVLD